MLDYDHIGFQTQRDLRNFLDCIQALLPDVTISRDANHAICVNHERDVYVGVFPISIDFDEFFLAAKSPAVEEITSRIKSSLNNRQIIFSVDRLDYIKGIPYRLDGIKRFLEKYPEMHKKVTFVQLVVPSRIQIAEYSQLKEHIDREVSEINSLFTEKGWVPIHYMFFPLSREELVAYYRSADAILVTSIKDGMNLVAKEYIASNVEEEGVVILSEFAGAACQLKDDAILINPYDVEGLADAIAQALQMPLEEKKNRMRSLRNNVRDNDIYRWISQIFLATHSKSY
jgi:trehalose 6-phosphate synthase